MNETTVANFVRLHELQNLFVHRESKRFSKIKESGDGASGSEIEDIQKTVIPEIECYMEDI